MGKDVNIEYGNIEKKNGNIEKNKAQSRSGPRLIGGRCGGRGVVWGVGVCGGGEMRDRGCYVIGDVKFDVKFDVTVFDVTVFDVPVFDVNSSSPFHGTQGFSGTPVETPSRGSITG